MEIVLNIHPALIREWRASHESVLRADKELQEFMGRDSKYDMWKLDVERYKARLEYLTKERNGALVRNFSLGEKIALLAEAALQKNPIIRINDMMNSVFPSSP